MAEIFANIRALLAVTFVSLAALSLGQAGTANACANHEQARLGGPVGPIKAIASRTASPRATLVGASDRVFSDVLLLVEIGSTGAKDNGTHRCSNGHGCNCCDHAAIDKWAARRVNSDDAIVTPKASGHGDSKDGIVLALLLLHPRSVFRRQPHAAPASASPRAALLVSQRLRI